MEEAVSVVADHSISISRTESLRQGLPSRPCRVGQFKRARGFNPPRIEVPVLALDIFQLAGVSRGCDSDD
jgi:hypothetical protein